MQPMSLFALSPFPRRRWQPPLLMFAALVLLAAGAGSVRADACSSCPAPALEDLAKQAGFTLHALPPDIFGNQSTDYVETDAGDCTYTARGDPTASITSSKMVLRGLGEVWNCPESSSEDQITYSIATGDSTSWAVEGEVGVTLKAVALEVAGKVTGTTTTGRTINEVKTVTKTLRAAMGHRIPWEGYFEIATLALTVEFDVTRRWSWWTKNAQTYDVVLRSGSIWMACGSEKVSLSRMASIGYAIHLFDRACGLPPGIPPNDLGWFPLPPTTPRDKPPPPPPAPTPLDPPPASPPADEEPGGGDAGPDPSEPPQPTPAPAPVPAPGTTPPPADEPYADPGFQVWPAPWAPTGPLPDPTLYTLADGTLAATVGEAEEPGA